MSAWGRLRPKSRPANSCRPVDLQKHLKSWLSRRGPARCRGLGSTAAELFFRCDPDFHRLQSGVRRDNTLPRNVHEASLIGYSISDRLNAIVAIFRNEARNPIEIVSVEDQIFSAANDFRVTDEPAKHCGNTDPQQYWSRAFRVACRRLLMTKSQLATVRLSPSAMS
jgi:hypothetical protein